jgi:RNA polymerase sigma factor (sigma-70 family)
VGGEIVTGREAIEATSVVTDLFESAYGIFLRYAVRMTSSHEVAEDVVQEALMLLYREIRKGTTIENPKAWTFCVIRRLLSKEIRSHRRHSALMEPLEAGGDFAFAALSPEEHNADLDDVTALLSVLTSREQEVTLLRMTPMKYREIAEQLGISPKSVATLLARALRKLQRAAGVATRPSKNAYVDPVTKTLH